MEYELLEKLKHLQSYINRVLEDGIIDDSIILDAIDFKHLKDITEDIYNDYTVMALYRDLQWKGVIVWLLQQ